MRKVVSEILMTESHEWVITIRPADQAEWKATAIGGGLSLKDSVTVSAWFKNALPAIQAFFAQ